MTPEQHAKLLHALTAYDRRMETRGRRGGWNPYAMGHYCQAIANTEEEMAAGKSIRAALQRCFNGRLLDICLKAVGESLATDAEHRACPLYR